VDPKSSVSQALLRRSHYARPVAYAEVQALGNIVAGPFGHRPGRPCPAPDRVMSPKHQLAANREEFLLRPSLEGHLLHG